MCQLTGHAEYLVSYSTCPLIHGGLMEKIKEQSSNIEEESPKELTPDKQQLGLAPRAALPQLARPALGYSSSASRVLPQAARPQQAAPCIPGPGCSPPASKALHPGPWQLDLSEQGPDCSPSASRALHPGCSPSAGRAPALWLLAPQRAGPCPWLLALASRALHLGP